MSTANNTPELRFPEFLGEWAEIKGGQLFNNSRAKGEEGLPIYSVTLNDGLVPRNSLGRRMENNAASEANLRAQPGDLVYNMMRMWQGAVGLADVECMVSPAYIVLSGKKATDTRFFNYNLERSRPLYDLWAYSYGLTSDRLRLYFKDFGQIKFWVPSKKDEQQKIVVFLDSVDEKLGKLRRKRELLETWKRGLMQKIFSQEIRFTKADPSGKPLLSDGNSSSGTTFPDWEEKKLGDVATFTKGKGISKSDIDDDGSAECIRYGELYTHYGETIDEVKSKTNIKPSELVLSKANDVIIPASGETRLDIATASCVIVLLQLELDNAWFE